MTIPSPVWSGLITKLENRVLGFYGGLVSGKMPPNLAGDDSQAEGSATTEELMHRGKVRSSERGDQLQTELTSGQPHRW